MRQLERGGSTFIAIGLSLSQSTQPNDAWAAQVFLALGYVVCALAEGSPPSGWHLPPQALKGLVRGYADVAKSLYVLLYHPGVADDTTKTYLRAIGPLLNVLWRSLPTSLQKEVAVALPPEVRKDHPVWEKVRRAD